MDRDAPARAPRQRVHVGALDLDVDFARGEELRTEICAKFRRARLEADYAAAGLELDGWWTDERDCSRSRWLGPEGRGERPGGR